jgi:hypothetical protein
MAFSHISYSYNTPSTDQQTKISININAESRSILFIMQIADHTYGRPEIRYHTYGPHLLLNEQ